MKKHATIDYYIQLILIFTLLMSIVLSFTSVYFLSGIWMMIYLIIGGVQLLSLAVYYFRFKVLVGNRHVYAYIVFVQLALLLISFLFELEFAIGLLFISLIFVSPLQLIGYFLLTREWYQQEKLHDALYLR